MRKASGGFNRDMKAGGGNSNPPHFCDMPKSEALAVARSFGRQRLEHEKRYGEINVGRSRQGSLFDELRRYWG